MERRNQKLSILKRTTFFAVSANSFIIYLSMSGLYTGKYSTCHYLVVKSCFVAMLGAQAKQKKRKQQSKAGRLNLPKVGSKTLAFF